MVVKTYRGLLADGGQDRIRLQTIKGKVGYRVIKLDLMAPNPGTQSQESTVKIYKEQQSSITGTIDFTDSALLAVGIYHDNHASYYPTTMITIFDREIVNQDIYITQTDNDASQACNYYLELEVIPLDDVGAEYTTLKDMRQV